MICLFFNGFFFYFLIYFFGYQTFIFSFFLLQIKELRIFFLYFEAKLTHMGSSCVCVYAFEQV